MNVLGKHSYRRTTRPARRRAGGGWLSLFAMWMIFIGPLISQSMPMEHHTGMSMSMSSDMAMNMPMPASHAHADSKQHHNHSDDAELHALWAKCGYCTLLFNCPALPQSFSPLNASRVPPAPPPPSATRHGHARQAIFPGARSRAPPAQSIYV